jgi:hypothetical protein
VILYEQFVRQSLDMKSKPVIAFSTSDTPNWDVAECKEKENQLKPVLTFAEKEILTLYEAGKHAKKAALIPKPEIRPHFQYLLPLIPLYRTSGILTLIYYIGYALFFDFHLFIIIIVYYVMGWCCEVLQ